MRRTFLEQHGVRALGLALAAWAVFYTAQVQAAAQRPYAPVERIVGPAAVWRGLERELLLDAADGSLDRFSLLGAALVASGVDNPARLTAYQAHVAELVRQWRDSGQIQGAPRQRAEALFTLMHRCCLRGGYRFECTNLTSVLDEGRFNCVSASVFFCCLGREFGLDVRGLEVPGHAMSCLVLQGEMLPVESTCPDWFRLSADPARRADLLRKTLGSEAAAVAVQTGPKRRQVSSAALIATIYYNRGVDLLNHKRFAEAAAANLKALELDPANETARGNLLATLNNWAIHEGSQGRYQQAADLLNVGLAVAPDFKTFAINRAHVQHQWRQAQKRGPAAGNRPLGHSFRPQNDRPGLE
ncbi:MAG: hypothetical protein JW818_17820 [Pirellulales bacterium]|nr:hypothetical protein [Pirellulales bacterium]